MLDELYDRSRLRTTALVGGLRADLLDAPVPATPLWTVRQLVAHLTGAAADSVAGRTDGVGTPPWTAAQVASRGGLPLGAVLDEWTAAGRSVALALADRRCSPMIVHDALTHEADLREALGRGRPPEDDVAAALDHLARGLCKRFTGPGTLVLRAGGEEWRGGAGDATAVSVGPYELYRGLISRRSRAQMRAWDWTGDPDPLIEALPAFGPCAVDQPVPA